MLDFGFYNMDCMEGMKQFPDKYFDLAIVDPPYGDAGGVGAARNASENVSTDTGTQAQKKSGAAHHERAPEGLRSSGLVEPGRRSSEKNHRVGRGPGAGLLRGTVPRLTEPGHLGGGNYFELPATRCFLIWRKTNVSERFSMAMAEYAWTSFNGNAKVFDFSAVGQPGRFHPTQKPPELYKWILANFAKDGDTILDTHVGSASSLVACRETGHKYVGFEIDPDYYKLAKARVDAAEAQGNIFDYQ